jgi:hypothetical protein
MKRGFCLALIAMLSACASVSTTADVIVGAWKFETDRTQKKCVLSGAIMFDPPVSGKFSCHLTVTESCDSGFSSTVQQSCTAGFEFGRLVVESRQARLLSASPPTYEAALREGRITYAPDNFKISTFSATEMTGRFFAYTEAKVRFWRPQTITAP